MLPPSPSRPRSPSARPPIRRRASRDLFRLAAASVGFFATLGASAYAQNQPPSAPAITEPASNGQIVNAQDVHMETGPFSDPNPGDLHLCTDWEIWTVNPPARVWSTLCIGGFEKLHTHLGDGVFEGTHAGWTQLFPLTSYKLRVRHRDDSGDAATEWSPWSERLFSTGASAQPFPLEIDDVADDVAPRWVDATTGADIDLPGAPGLIRVRLEDPSGALLLQIDAAGGPGNLLTNAPPLTSHAPVRVRIRELSGTAFSMPASDLTIVEHACEAHTILLPPLQLAPGGQQVFWVSADGATWQGFMSQSGPDFSTLLRTHDTGFVPRQPGFSVEVFAEGFQLPVNLALVPNPGPGPADPFLYVTELYGAIRTVTRDGTVHAYATNLLNYTPSGVFPGSGEQGLTGLAVDPATGDVYASLLYKPPGQSTSPKVVRFTSFDGGMTAATMTTILDMPGESQGQSHQISRLEFGESNTLYVHMGDGFSAGTAQNLSSFRGKILRINRDGTPFAGNPFFSAADGITARDYVFSYGVRNPFGGAWRAADGLRYVVENGPSIDRLARLESGKNYLWNGSDGSMKNFAIHNWQPATGPVNIAFVQPETFGGSGFPSAKMGHAFVTESGATYGNGVQAHGKQITEFVFDAQGGLVAGPIPFLDYVGTGRSTVAGLAAGPDGLYFTDLYEETGVNGPTGAGARILVVRGYDASDCDGDGEPDFCEIARGEADCNANGIPDACEIASGAATDYDGNGVPDVCDPLAEDRDTVSIASGGAVAFTLDAGPAHAGDLYLLLGSASGSTPGTSIGPLHLPLNLAGDPWFPLTVEFANTAILVNTLGALDAAGAAAASFHVPANAPPAVLGVTLRHAFLAFDPGAGNAPVFASNAVPVTFTP